MASRLICLTVVNPDFWDNLEYCITVYYATFSKHCGSIKKMRNVLIFNIVIKY